jgi:hypothetical protein
MTLLRLTLLRLTLAADVVAAGVGMADWASAASRGQKPAACRF